MSDSNKRGLAEAEDPQPSKRQRTSDGKSSNESQSIDDIDFQKEISKIHQMLLTCDFPGDFAGQGEINNVPSLRIKDTENNESWAPSFPLSEEDIKRLIKHCETAPYGKGEETVVDESVRKCWQLDPSKFDFDSGDILTDNVLKEIASIVAPNVYPHGQKLEAQIHKLLVYEPGCFFKPHRDTPRGERHFATVIVSLPSRYKGGQLVVRHNGQERTYESFNPRGRLPKSKCTWTVFYADTEHEVLPVKSGYRVTLSYHLFRPEQEMPQDDTEAFLGKGHPVVQKLKQIACMPGCPDHVGYLLEHKYTPKGVAVGNLKGRDRMIYRLLEPHFTVRLLPIEIRINAWGNADEASYASIYDVEPDEGATIEISELDTTQKKEKRTMKAHFLFERHTRFVWPSRLISTYEDKKFEGPVEAWIEENMIPHIAAMKRVDQRIQGSGNEGCDFHQTYQHVALIITLGNDTYPSWKQFSFDHSIREYPYCGV